MASLSPSSMALNRTAPRLRTTPFFLPPGLLRRTPCCNSSWGSSISASRPCRSASNGRPAIPNESANEYTDDEDVNWKVQRAVAKCLAALIVARPEILAKLYEEACPKLIRRFRESEENTKMDVFSTFTELLQQTGNVKKSQFDINEQITGKMIPESFM